jgi:exosortase A-associated hydrolase 1
VNFTETAATFECAGETLVGIADVPQRPRSRGVLIIVGGPQYRVGSHRQFVLFARRLASEGFPAFRFDYRGMGDATGEYITFKQIADDIRTAIATFQKLCPQVREVVLWGLCGAASASMIYAPGDDRVAGIVALNPWVRDSASFATTQIRHYYGPRVLQRDFWTKLVRGEVGVIGALRAFLRTLWTAAVRSASSGASKGVSYQARMAQGLASFSGPTLLILSGNDLTAKEFLTYVSGDGDWAGVLNRPSITRRDFPGADHTFSTHERRREVEDTTLRWLAAF